MPAPTPISRRESLRRAAGALALGLGAPAALAAGVPDARRGAVLSFYKEDLKGDPIYKMEIPEEVAAVLMEPGAFSYLKIDGMVREQEATFEVRRQR